MKSYPKDKELEGIYVKRCKCGARPYYDRVCSGSGGEWIACNCGRSGEVGLTKQEAIDNWNSDKLYYPTI
jgi:hypothetical protein